MTDSNASREVLLRLSGELSTKARRTRRRFEKRLVRNLADAGRAHDLRWRVARKWSRLVVSCPDQPVDDVLEVVGRVFGVSSYSIIDGRCRASLDEIVERGRALYAEEVKGRRFAVRARRVGKHSFSSYDVQRELGTALNPGATVDLSHPDVVVGVEVREQDVYFVGTPRPGAAGLPLGVQGKAVALISGGYDSAVAAWMTLRRGVELDYLFCNLGGAAYRRLTIEVVKALTDRWSYGTEPRLHVVDFGPVMDEFRRTVKPAYWQVTLKRMMYLAAAEVAEEVGADAIVTGESIGQVSSQTLANLRAIDAVAPLPVIRPLVGFDKEEILERARRIGTYDLSSRVREYCDIVPDRPVTAARTEVVAQVEREVDLSVLRAAVAERDVLEPRAVDVAELVGSHLFVSEIGDRAVVIDTRDPAAYLDWHWPGALHRDHDDLLRGLGDLERDHTYVLYCGEGIISAHLAERMQSKGYEAYSFRGGVRGLRRFERAAEGVKADPDG